MGSPLPFKFWEGLTENFDTPGQAGVCTSRGYAALGHRFLRDRPDRVAVWGMGAKGCALGTLEGIRFFQPAPWMHSPGIPNARGTSIAEVG